MVATQPPLDPSPRPPLAARRAPGTLAFGVLGPLELTADGRSWPVPGRRERMLLALLLTTPGRVVPVSDIAAGLWGESPPRGAEKTVQSYVSRLRTALPGRGAGLVVTRSPGYLVAAAEEQVDAGAFRALAARARGELARGALRCASASAEAALSLWRGGAYLEFDAPFAAVARTALEEERSALEVDRVEVLLRLGAGPELVGELEALVAQHPWQERLWGQLMTALYRSGRQSDALLAFRRAQAGLRDELGVDPGPELQRVARMVLAQDRRLEPSTPAPPRTTVGDADGPGPGPTAGSTVCPFKGLAPYDEADAAWFAGRQDVVDRVVARLVDRPLVLLVGPSGSGRTSVLRAGVLPAVRAGVVPGSQSWRVVTVPRSGQVPEPRAGGRRTLVVADPLEELLPRRGAGASEQLTRLVEAARDPGVTVLAAVREDHLDLLRRLAPELVPSADAVVRVGGPSEDELRWTVEAAAAAAGLTVETGLARALGCELAGRGAALPLLSVTLLALWERRRGDVLGTAAYQAAGGVPGVLASLAGRSVSGLDADQRAAARRVLLRLADRSDRVERAAGPTGAAPSDLGLDHDPEARAVVETLASDRLLTVRAERIEPGHEALLEACSPLDAWLAEDPAERRRRRLLIAMAEAWDASGRSDDDLVRGQRLAEAGVVSRLGGLSALGEEFVRAGEALARREASARRRAARLVAALLAALAAAVLLAVALALAAPSGVGG